MKTYTQYLWFDTKKRKDPGHSTVNLFDILERRGIHEGMKPVAASDITKRSPMSWRNKR